jgi:cell division protease FtsH
MIPDKEYSPETARIIDEEIKHIIDAAYADAERIVAERWDTVTAIAEALLKHETLQSNEVKTLISGGTIDRPTITDLLDAESGATPPTPSSLDTTDTKASVDDADDGLLPAPA